MTGIYSKNPVNGDEARACVLVAPGPANLATLPASVPLVTVHGPTEGASPSQPWNRLVLGTVVDEAVLQAGQLTEADR